MRLHINLIYLWIYRHQFLCYLDILIIYTSTFCLLEKGESYGNYKNVNAAVYIP